MLARIVAAYCMGLGIDESYAVSIDWSLSYFDHPPLHFWLTHAAMYMFGNVEHLVVRLPFLLLSLLTALLLFRLTKKIFDDKAGFFSVLFYCTTPIANYFGLAVLPDGPLVPAMLAAAFVMLYMIEELDSDSARHRRALWLTFGVCTGLAILSKYTGVFMYFGLFLYALTQGKLKKLLCAPALYMASLATLIVISPILIWNSQHQWISFLFQGSRVASASFQPLYFLTMLGGQAGYLLPWVWFMLIYSSCAIFIKAGCFDKIAQRKQAISLLCLASGPVILFTIPSLWGGTTLPHWAVPGYVLLFPLLGRVAERAHERRAAWPKVLAILSTAIFIFMVSVLSVLSIRLPATMENSKYALRAHEALSETLDWQGLSEYTARTQLLTTSHADFILCYDYLVAAKVNYALYGKIPVLCINPNPHQFYFEHDYAAFIGKTALIIVDKDKTAAIAQTAKYFSSYKKIGEISPLGSMAPRRKTVILIANNFKGWNPNFAGFKSGKL